MSAELVQGSPEWLAFRKPRIGASDGYVIAANLPRFKNETKPSWLDTCFVLFCRKTDRLPPRAVTPQMRRGTVLEPTIRVLVEAELGDTFRPVVLTHPQFDWIIASLDGHRVLLELDRSRAQTLEIKAPGRETHEAARREQKPPWYYWTQMQHQFAAAEAEEGFYASYHPESEEPLVILTVRRDEDFIKELIAAEEQFRFCLVSDTAPPLTDRDERVRLDPEWTELAEEYRRAESVVSEWEGKRKAAREALIAMADGCPRVRGAGLLLSLNEVKGRVNYDKVPELRGVDLSPYRGPTRMEHRLTVERPK